MCENRLPLSLSVLHAMRLAAQLQEKGDVGLDDWLEMTGMAAAAPTIETLAGRLAAESQDAPCLAAPGETMARPAEEALLKALGQACRAPEQAESLLAFLPGPQRAEVAQLLAELAEQLRANTTRRLRHIAQTT